jgi:outer membrane protein OmpA-like peptidoglycan-associated protein
MQLKKWVPGVVLAVLVAGCAVVGCTQSPPNTTPTSGADLDLPAAIKQLASDLARQIRGGAGARTAVIDPIIDRATGQQTAASQRVEQEVGPALTSAVNGLKLFPFNSQGATASQWVVTGNLASSESGRYTANVAISDRQSAIVVAQSAVRFRDGTLSDAPTRFYNDSPSVGRDRSIDGLVATSETPAGKAADALYIDQLPTSALLAEGLIAYNAERWEEALKFYSAAAARADGQQLRTFNGLYLANLRLGRSAPAEEAFGRIATLGLATNNLAVKLLFRTGTTEFLQGSDLSGVYPMWIRQIARAAQASKTCLNVVGHTSRSGSEALNDKLSMSRGEAVRGLLEREAKGLAGQLRASGVGYRENLVGSGTDDARDAVDRRVEFKVVPCGK